MNPNHDPKNGEFSSGGGTGGPQQHANASANAHDVHEALSHSPLSPQWGKNGAANAREAARVTQAMGYEAEVYRNSKSNFIAAYSQGKVKINASNKYWKDPVANAKRLEGQLSSGSPEHIIHHEIGHAMYDPPDNFHNQMGERELIGQHVSKYAQMNPKEFVSEVHAGIKAGKQYPDKIMQMFHVYARPRVER